MLNRKLSKKFEGTPIVKLPIDVQRDFNASFRFLIPKFNKKYFLFISINDDLLFMITPKQLLVNMKNSEGKVSQEKLSTTLDKGKNKEVLVEFEKRGRTTNLYINNMEVYTTTDYTFTNPTFNIDIPFGILKIDEISVTQRVED